MVQMQKDLTRVSCSLSDSEFKCAARAVQLYPDGGQFDFARPSARTPCGGASYVQVSWRNQEKYPPEERHRPFP